MVEVPKSFEDEDTFLKAAGWTRKRQGDRTTYQGSYETAYCGKVPGYITRDQLKSNGRLISEEFNCYVKQLPERVKRYIHGSCFSWIPREQAFHVHFQNSPSSIQQAILSTESAIDHIVEGR